MTAIIPKVSKLSSRVIRVLGCNASPMTLQGTNTYLIGSGSDRLLLDCGEPNVTQYLTNLKQVVEENGIHLSRIIITHWHSDHLGGTTNVFNTLNLNHSECKVHKLYDEEHDRPYLDSLQFDYLKDGQSVRVSDATLKVVATPGHTKDHLVVMLEEEKALFSGDCILGEGTGVFEDLYEYMKSLNRILELNPSVIYPGHGPVIDDPTHKIKEYIAHRLEREQQIIDALKTMNKALTPMEIVRTVYKGLSEQLYTAAAYNVSHHLDKLVKEDIVHTIEENGDLKYIID